MDKIDEIMKEAQIEEDQPRANEGYSVVQMLQESGYFSKNKRVIENANWGDRKDEINA